MAADSRRPARIVLTQKGPVVTCAVLLSPLAMDFGPENLDAQRAFAVFVV